MPELSRPGDLSLHWQEAGAGPPVVPEARLVAVADGAIKRPDQTAAVIRRITGAGA